MMKETKQDELDKGLWTVIMTTALSEQDFKQLEEYLDKGANLNAQLKGETPLTWAVYRRNTNLLKFFIQRGADINLKNSSGWTPLGYSILGKQLPYIEILCDAGALLVNPSSRYYGANAFHCAISMGKSEAKEIAKILMTHARFDSYDKDQKKKEGKVLAALSVLSILPFEIRLFILEKLTTLDDDYCSNKKLCKQLLSKNRTSPILIQISRQVENLKQILASKDDKDKQSPLEWAGNEPASNKHNKEILSLLDRNELQKNWDDFNAKFPDILKSDPDNPVCLMYNNCAKLLEDKK